MRKKQGEKGCNKNKITSDATYIIVEFLLETGGIVLLAIEIR